ncbi:hypothetical protein HDU83_001800 [Entophlyctis luteolus]|nr:hypothetical protein HDU82_001094 [Entophlyctis luteolus]KAJ3347797.1 hypothetical protein HDU83_001800 [Entophlyctis luteolus]
MQRQHHLQQQHPIASPGSSGSTLDCVAADPAAQFNIMFAQMQQSLSFPPLPRPELAQYQQQQQQQQQEVASYQQQQQQQTQFSLQEPPTHLPLFSTASAHQPGFGPPSPSASPIPVVRGAIIAQRRSKSTSDAPMTDEQVKRIRERERKKKRELSRGLTCSNCGTRETPLWRRTSDRMNMLCNACGIYVKHYGVHRKVSVPQVFGVPHPPAPRTAVPQNNQSPSGNITPQAAASPPQLANPFFLPAPSAQGNSSYPSYDYFANGDASASATTSGAQQYTQYSAGPYSSSSVSYDPQVAAAASAGAFMPFIASAFESTDFVFPPRSFDDESRQSILSGTPFFANDGSFGNRPRVNSFSL